MKNISSGLLAAAMSMYIGTSAQGAVLATNSITITDGLSGGQVQVVSTIFDNFAGDFTKQEWRYDITNLSYDPQPGASNGLSGFQLIFAAAGAGFANQYGPAPGWGFNAFSGSGPPTAAEWDITDAQGLGIMPGGVGTLGFTTNVGVPWTSNYFGSWAHSWVNVAQINVFNQQDPTNGQGPLVPFPTPGALALFAVAGAMSASRRRR